MTLLCFMPDLSHSSFSWPSECCNISIFQLAPIDSSGVGFPLSPFLRLQTPNIPFVQRSGGNSAILLQLRFSSQPENNSKELCRYLQCGCSNPHAGTDLIWIPAWDEATMLSPWVSVHTHRCVPKGPAHCSGMAGSFSADTQAASRRHLWAEKLGKRKQVSWEMEQCPLKVQFRIAKLKQGWILELQYLW